MTMTMSFRDAFDRLRYLTVFEEIAVAALVIATTALFAFALYVVLRATG